MELADNVNEVKLISIFIFLFMLDMAGLAQTGKAREKYFTKSFNTGYLGVSPSSHSSYTGSGFSRSVGIFAQDNGRNRLTLTGITSLGAGLGYMWKNLHNDNMWAINFDFQQNRNSYVFDLPFKKKIPTRGGDGDADDPYTGDSTSVTTGSWTETDKYLKLSAGIQHFWYLNDKSLFFLGDQYWYLKFSVGETFLHRNQGSTVRVGQTDSGTDEIGNVTSAKTISANPVSYMLSSEIGLCSISPDKDQSISFGIAWHLPLTSSYTRQYEFFTKTPETAKQPSTLQSTGKEDIKFQGGSILLNVTYSFNSKIIPRPIDTLKIWKKLQEPPPKPIVQVHKPRKINGRRVHLVEKIELGDSLVEAFVWDKGKIDGDRITLYLNGKEILNDYTVAHSKKEILLHLNPGRNFLVMHAINLGRIPPNTAAIEFYNGSKLKQLVLNSDTKTSEALELDYVER